MTVSGFNKYYLVRSLEHDDFDVFILLQFNVISYFLKNSV